MTAPPAPKKVRRSEASRRSLESSVVCESDSEDSPFTLFFVKALDGSPTDKEQQNFRELFHVAKEAGCLPEYIEPDLVLNLPTSNDFFVIPCFRGELFRKIQEKQLKIYGPPILLECITEQKELPQKDHPIFSSVFEGTHVTFTNIAADIRETLYQKVGWMNGNPCKTLSQETSHLVCGKAAQSEKYKVATKNCIKLMKTDWIEDFWEKSKTAIGRISATDDDSIEAYKLKPFEGMVFAMSGVDGVDRTNLIQLVEEHGGKLPGNMVKNNCTHLIIDQTKGAKYTKAVQWKTVHIVQTRWIRKCIDLGHLTDETKYHPKFLSAEHLRSSTPKRDSNLTQTVPDVSTIAGQGGRLNTSSFTFSSALTQNSAHRRQSGTSFVSMGSTSNVASSTLNNNDSLIGENRRRSDQSTPIVRTSSVTMSRYPSTQNTSTQNSQSIDPIDKLIQLSEGLDDLFSDCLFYVCGAESRIEKWMRFLSKTGATRARKLESATNVVVVAPTQQDKLMLRKHQREDVAMVTVNWVVECVKQRTLIPHEDFKWTEHVTEESQSQESQPSSFPIARHQSNQSLITSLTSFSESPPVQMKGIFSGRVYCVHKDVRQDLRNDIEQKILSNGGALQQDPYKADFVVFGHSAPLYITMDFEMVVTDLYINVCISQEPKRHVGLSESPLFVPLPKPPLEIFGRLRFYLHLGNDYLKEFVKGIIELNGGVVQNRPDAHTYCISRKGEEEVPSKFRSKSADLIWVIASVSKCQLQPIEKYRSGGEGLENYQREDDVWVKCTKEKDTTQEMEEDPVEEVYPMGDDPTDVSSSLKSNKIKPLDNPYFPDLKVPYKTNLNLNGAYEYINNMDSPQRESQESMTTSRVGSILRKAAVITGRIGKENAPETCFERPLSTMIVDNRRTVSSTPVLVRDVDRSLPFMPMDESFAEQNREHEELNRYHKSHPHFLLSVSGMERERIARLEEQIRELGGHIEPIYNKEVTHFISNKVIRTPKFLSCIASGKWLLTSDYVTESVEAGRWLDEEPFEWAPDKVPPTATEIVKNLVSVCAKWRNKIAKMAITFSVEMENRRNGAFTGWRCVIHEQDQGAQSLAPVLEAGGAVVFTVSEYIEIATLERPNMAIVDRRFPWEPQSARMLKRDNIPLYYIDVIYEYLIKMGNFDQSKCWHTAYRSV